MVIYTRTHMETSRLHSSSVVGKPLFGSPLPASRKIISGFSWVQRIGKSASFDVWFPAEFRRELDTQMSLNRPLSMKNFPAQWAAVRQFELLQEAGNYKIYDMDATYLTRSLTDMANNMRAGGYRMTVATLGSYTSKRARDELAILDKQLQDHFSHLIHMLYLEEQSLEINGKHDEELMEGKWSFFTALPHISATLCAKNLFRPPKVYLNKEKLCIPSTPYVFKSSNAMAWACNYNVIDADTNVLFTRVGASPASGEYSIAQDTYQFSATDCGREIIISNKCEESKSAETRMLDSEERKVKLAEHFFSILGQLPQEHIIHDTAIGLQLPELISENEWIYIAPGDKTLQSFNSLLKDLFEPFDIYG